MKAVQFVNDIPQSEHWIILKNRVTHVEGDERSKNHPGHGYPEHTDHTIEVDVACSTEAEFLDELGKRIRASNNDGTYRGFKVQPYTTKLVVETQRVRTEIPAKTIDDLVNDGYSS